MAKSYSLTKLSLAVALCCAGSQAAWAEIHAADAQTQVSKQGAVEIINIATPSQAGLSHNKYNEFNVDKAGAVLNNARQSGKSQLAGDLNANPNLKTHSATVILNEVVGRNPSKLNGSQEIFGQKADYVLANPNGISTNNAGFINTPRASLVVGKPQVEQGKLTGYDVTGSNALTSNGKLSSDGDIDFIAPQVNVSSAITTSEGVNVIAGRNTIARDEQGTLTITSVEKTGQVLDGKVAGSIQAGRIRIHSTDDRATISTEAADFQAKEVAITAGNARLHGKVSQHKTQSNHNRNERGVAITESQQNTTQSYQATKVKADKFTLDVTNHADISGADLQAKDTQITAGSVHLGKEKTTNSSAHSKHQSKGSWYRNEQDQSLTETTHRTTIQGENVQIIANKGKVTGEGAKITLTNGGIYGEQGIQLQGAKAAKNEAAQAEFKRESAKLKTGSSSQNAVVEQYTASELNVKETLVLGGKGDINFAGVVGKVDGDVIVKNSGKTTFTAEKTQESHNIHDDHKFWGGLAGAKTLGSGKNAQVVHGSDFTIEGVTTMDAQNGVTLSGSRVVSGKGGVVKGNQGALVIDAVNAKVTESEHSRVGTAFNITKARQNNFKQTSTAHGSTLKSESNLQLSTDKGVSIIGSNVDAKGALEIAARSGIDIRGAKNIQREQSSEAGFSFGARFDSFKATFEKGHATANIAIENQNGKPSVSSDLTLSPNKKEGAISTEANFSAGLHIYKNQKDSQTVSHTASNVNGGAVALNANKVNVSGSQVNATQGDLAINANMINTQADKNHSTTNSVSNTGDVGLKGTLTNKQLTLTLGIDVAHELASEHATTSQTSQLSAANNLNLNANRIQHQGTQLQAGGNVQENAKTIVHGTAKDESNTFGRNVNVNVGVTTTVDTSKALNVEASIGANGGREIGYTSTHKGTQITAGNNINVNTNTLNDIASQYNAGENVTLNSKQHNFAAANNESRKDALKAGAEVGVSVGTSDFQSFNLGVNAGANFQKDQSAASNAVVGSVNGKNVSINTSKLNSQANIHGSENVNVNATQSAHFTQATNTASQSGGGFDAKVGVGAIVLPSAGVAVPSIDVSAKVNGNKGNSATAVTNTISGNNVNVHSNGAVSLQGTNVDAKQNANISGKQVTMTAANGHTQNVAVNVGAGVNIGEKVSSVGIEGNLGVKHENSTAHTGVNLNGANVNVQGQNGVTLSGVSSQSTHLNLDAGKGNLNLTAPQSNTNKTDFGASLKLNGGVAENKWTPNAGGASLDVNVVRNETYTGTALNTQNANVNAGGNAQFNGGAINAEQATGTIAGNSHTETLTNKINETSVSLSANGSGKFTPYPADKWAESAKKDWENGTIAGVKADAKVEVAAKREESHTQAGVSANNNHVVVKGQSTRNHPNSARKKVVNFKGSATTQLKNQVVKPPKALHVQIAQNNKLVLKAQLKR